MITYGFSVERAEFCFFFFFKQKSLSLYHIKRDMNKAYMTRVFITAETWKRESKVNCSCHGYAFLVQPVRKT